MTNVAHASLTGANLHEPKGAASASASQVYVANGSGSGTWTNVSSLVTSPSQNSFSQVLHVRRENTTIQGLSAGSWVNAPITTSVYNNIASASISDPFITLPAGNYFVYATFPAYRCGKFAIRWWDASTNGALLTGGQGYSGASADVISRAEMHGRFTLAGTHSCTLQYLTELGGYGDYVGTSGINTGVTHEVLVWKLP